MSELKAGHPPCPKMQRAALQGDPVSHSNNPCIENPTEAVTDFQAASLRRRFEGEKASNDPSSHHADRTSLAR
jgi:hypothetical protein